VTAGLIVMAKPLVSVLFQRGAFNPQNTVVTSQALIGYASGFFFVGLYYILQRIFIVARRTLLLMGLAVINVGLKLLLNLIFIRAFATTGIAIATTIMYAISATLMLVLLIRFLSGLELFQIAGRVAKMALAALFMGCGCMASIKAYVHFAPQLTFGAKMLMILFSTSIGVGLYAISIWALNIQEARKFYGFIFQILPFKKKSD
jgi:putative peptidoglycan lipid II flippase